LDGRDCTYGSIARENRMVKPGEKTLFSTPKKAKSQARVIHVDKSLEHTIRTMFYVFHVVEKR
jgi:hypothetical protein